MLIAECFLPTAGPLSARHSEPDQDLFSLMLSWFGIVRRRRSVVLLRRSTVRRWRACVVLRWRSGRTVVYMRRWSIHGDVRARCSLVRTRRAVIAVVLWNIGRRLRRIAASIRPIHAPLRRPRRRANLGARRRSRRRFIAPRVVIFRAGRGLARVMAHGIVRSVHTTAEASFGRTRNCVSITAIGGGLRRGAVAAGRVVVPRGIGSSLPSTVPVISVMPVIASRLALPVRIAVRRMWSVVFITGVHRTLR